MTSTTGVKIPPPVHNSLKLKALDPASQAGRITFPGQTRGQKADRLQLVATLKPLADAEEYHWSATGIAFSNGNAYVSWHSNHQAHTAATRWGGAVDQVSIQAILSVDQPNVFTRTQTLQTAKLNNVVANGNTLYFPMTCYNNGAVIGRMTVGQEAIDTIAVPGSSANAVAIENGNVYAVSGYAGGAYTLNFDAAEGEDQFTVVSGIPRSETFGGKYIAGGYVLRTDDDASQIVRLSDGATRSLGAPLTSTEKFAEVYDPAEGDWSTVEEGAATHFGKHTMAISDGYIYVGGGKGADKVNGFRVYNANSSDATPVWQNGTNTTAVCVEGDYVYAATGAGLRVYKKYEAAPEKGENFKLFAYEVKEYDEQTGMAIGHTAGTSGHSGNFVAVDPASGLIFVAYGQSGVYVFRLDPTIPEQPELEPVTVTVTFKDGPNGNNIGNPIETTDVEPGSSVEVTKPQDPTKEGQEFLGWDPNPEATEPTYPKDGKVEVVAGNGDTDVVLYPIFKPTQVVVTWSNGYTDTPMKSETVDYGTTIGQDRYPQNLPTRDGYEFDGWTVNGSPVDYTYVAKGNVEIKATWKSVITFDINGGSGTLNPAKVDVKEGAKTTLPDGTGLTAPEGKYFNGWNTQDDGNGTNYPAGSEFTPTGNVTLYADWKNWEFALHFNGNPMSDEAGADLKDVPGVKYSHTSPIEIPSQEPSCGALYFCGWSTDQNLKPAIDNTWKTKVYRNKEDFTKNYTFATGETSVTLYAIWSTEVMGGAGDDVPGGQD